MEKGDTLGIRSRLLKKPLKTVATGERIDFLFYGCSPLVVRVIGGFQLQSDVMT
jgi:hypothetical protein